MTRDRPQDGARLHRRAPFVALLVIAILGVATVIVARLSTPGPEPEADRPPAWIGPLPPRREPLATKLALVELVGLGDRVFDEDAVMDFVADCAERGARGPLGPEVVDLGLPGGGDLADLIGAAGLAGLSYGLALPEPGWRAAAGAEPRSAFDDAVWTGLDDRPVDVLLARLAPAGSPGADAELFLAGTRSPTAACFALSALDHELRRLVDHVGSHLSLIVLRRGTKRSDWTLCGPGSDDPAVLDALGSHRVGEAAAILLGFRFD